MRSREEQIIDCAQYLISMRNAKKCTEYDLVECIVHEAEQRGRELERAEMGRDACNQQSRVVAEKDAEIARLNAELSGYRAGLSELVAKEVAESLKGGAA